MTKKEIEDLLNSMKNLTPESQEHMNRLIIGLAEGKSKWETMTVDVLPHYLAMYPRYMLEYICMFVSEFIAFLLFRLRRYINNAQSDENE